MTESTNTSACLKAIFEERGLDPDEFVETFRATHHLRAILEGESTPLDLYFASDVAQALGLDNEECSKLLKAIYDDGAELFDRRRKAS